MPAQRYDQVLPPAARERLAEIKSSGTWGSALSTPEFTAIKSVGFEPVGQVLGAAVFNIGYAGGDVCPTYGSRDTGGSSGVGGRRYTPAVFTVVSGAGSASAYGPLVNALYEARRRAIGRMSAECAALGGHGVVGVSLTIGPFSGGGVEFRATGTAIRAPGGIRLNEPFTSDLTGQEFAKLIMAGSVPVSLVLGISIGVRHDDWLTAGQSRWATGNVEVSGYTELVNRTRRDARERADARRQPSLRARCGDQKHRAANHRAGVQGRGHRPGRGQRSLRRGHHDRHRDHYLRQRTADQPTADFRCAVT